MKHLLPLLFFSLIIQQAISAQDYQIIGKVTDADTGEPMEASTVYVETIQDSTMVSYTISDKSGAFDLEFKTNLKKLNLFVSYNGYQPVQKEITLDQSVIQLGNVALGIQAEELEGVSVVAERVPITVKKDTLEFNSDSFKTRPDANVEDVLKKLPGVEIDSDGKITVNGKEVNKVLVNGQVFFSDDPKVATKTLPKEIINKIQITDTKTKEQEFSGEAGDGETKTINLTIKEDKNKGYMGRLTAGYGTDDRYQLSGLLNYFNDTERISVMAGRNNINNAGFSFDEIYDMVGNTGRRGFSFSSGGGFSVGGLSFGFGQGIVTSSNLGVSYANAKKDAYEIGANYFFSYSDSYNNEKNSRENLLPDNHFFTDSESSFEGSTSSNRGAANLEFDVDETLRISIEPELTVNRTNSMDVGSTVTTDEFGELINSNETTTFSDGMQRNFRNEMDIMKKLDTLGRMIRFEFSNNNSVNESVSNFNSIRNVYGDNASEEILDQLTESDNKTDSYELGASYTHPITKQMKVELEYEFSDSKTQNVKSVYDFEAETGDYTGFNSILSSDFVFENKQHTPSVSLRKDGEKFNFRLGARYILTDLDNEDFLQSSAFSNNYENLLFNGRVSYKLGKNKRLGVNYWASLNIPSVRQLQPIPDVSNPLNVVIGNPDLAPTVNQRINLNYNDYNWKERTGFFLYTGFYEEKDKVVSVTTTDEDFLRTTEYTNVNGNHNAYLGMSYSKQVKKDSTYTLKASLSPRFEYRNQVSFNNGLKLEAKTYTITPRASITFNYRELLEIEPEYSITFNNTKYNLDAFDNINYVTHRGALRTTTYWPNNLIWGNDIVYNYNGNVGESFDKDAIFWNMSLGVEFLKKKLNFKVIAYDLLDQNINTRRTTGQDFIQDYQGTVLQRYFMASLTFKFDQFGGSGAPGRGGSRFR
ncbi:TonB-dependent receptor [Galbibacter sp. EGI 63066]|uniref:outer membrane beta-barrel protein n=1 Tax=Galbibacter sp. EGI 63066 TaxID=2993559 RepID=UPI002249581B|nr:outer membrane beta-barrel protein [Galbibacter sp. EGI 63066]MCX2679407.1 TonB-dependent receptor [Galbibacter sp. EGI 63066]